MGVYGRIEILAEFPTMMTGPNQLVAIAMLNPVSVNLLILSCAMWTEYHE